MNRVPQVAEDDLLRDGLGGEDGGGGAAEQTDGFLGLGEFPAGESSQRRVQGAPAFENPGAALGGAAELLQGARRVVGAMEIVGQVREPIVTQAIALGHGLGDAASEGDMLLTARALQRPVRLRHDVKKLKFGVGGGEMFIKESLAEVFKGLRVFAGEDDDPRAQTVIECCSWSYWLFLAGCEGRYFSDY